MTAAKPTPDDLRMRGEEFDRMRKALQVKAAKGRPKTKLATKPKATGLRSKR
jgi:hypothetical protein